MKIRKRFDSARCCAMRCKEVPFEQHVYSNGEKVWFCRRHGHEAAVEAGKAKIRFELESLVQSEPTQLSIPFKPVPPPTLSEPEVLTVDDVAALEAVQKDQEKAQGQIARLFGPDRVRFLTNIKDKAESDLAELHAVELDASTIPFAESERDAARAMRRELEQLRTPVTKPLNAILRAVNGRFKPADTALAAVETLWTHKINDQQLRAKAERQRLLLAAQQATQAAEQATGPAAKQEATIEARQALIAASEQAQEPEGTVFIDRYRFEVTEPASLPREYLCPDERKIAARIEASRKVGLAAERIQIPGVRIWNDPIQRSRKS